MTKFYTYLLHLCTAVAIAMPAQAGVSNPLHRDISGYACTASTRANALKGNRKAQIDRVNAMIDRGQEQRFVTPLTAPANAYQPQTVINLTDSYGDLDGPNGTTWYYTAKYDNQIIKHEYYTEFILQGYTFTIFNDKMEQVGVINDRVTYGEHQTRVVQCDIAPIVTKNFFNGDDNYEVMVSLIYNTEYYINQYANVVYSLGGQQSNGHDVELYRFTDKLLGDVLDASTATEENVYMTFMQDGSDYEPAAGEDPEDPTVNYWAKYTSNYTMMEVLGKAKPGANEPTSIYKRKIPLVQMAGDQQDTPPMISYMHNGKPTYMIQQYDQPFYNEMASFMDDMSQRDGNKLTIELMEIDGEAMRTVQTTKIDVIHDTSAANIAASYFSTGMLRYRDDINYTDYNSGDQAAFIITRQNYISSSDSYIASYYVYNPDGTLRGTIFENADGTVGLTDIEGLNPQQMFVEVDAYGDYIFHFVDLKEIKSLMAISWLLEVEDSEPDRMTANLDRVKAGDSYKYVIEMRVPTLDADENNYMRAAWLNADGSFDRMDEVNMGQMVNFAQLYVEGNCMTPGYFHSDAKQEYMLLIKRAIGENVNQEELMIAQPVDADNEYGKTLLQLGPDPELGVLATIVTFNDKGNNRLMVSYTQDGPNNTALYTQHFYNLPLDNPTGSVNDIIGDKFDNANGPVEFFNLQGQRVANPKNGLFIKRQGGKADKVIL